MASSIAKNRVERSGGCLDKRSEPYDKGSPPPPLTDSFLVQFDAIYDSLSAIRIRTYTRA